MKVLQGLSHAQNKIFLIMLGGMFLEFFDFFLYIHLAPIVVDAYFTSSSSNTLTVYLLTIFSVIFIRILGVAVGGYIGDVYGRKPAMIISIITTGLCCIGFALVPSYETIGVLALVALMILRSLQSAASVNEISCAVTYMTEIIKRPYNYFVTALMEINGFLGMFVALLTASLVMSAYPEGWKILFFVSGIISFICFYFRTHYRTPSNLDIVFFDILSLNTSLIEAMILRVLRAISLMAFVTTSRPCRTIECCG